MDSLITNVKVTQYVHSEKQSYLLGEWVRSNIEMWALAHNPMDNETITQVSLMSPDRAVKLMQGVKLQQYLNTFHSLKIRTSLDYTYVMYPRTFERWKELYIWASETLGPYATLPGYGFENTVLKPRWAQFNTPSLGIYFRDSADYTMALLRFAQ